MLVTDMLAVIEPYRATSRGPNPWTEVAALHVYTYREHYQHAIDIVLGTLTSGYRSSRVNRLVGGEPTSRHMDGLAIDIVPRETLAISDAAAVLWSHALRNELGPVRTIIREPTWVHMDWYGLTEGRPEMRMLQKGRNTYSVVEVYNHGVG